MARRQGLDLVSVITYVNEDLYQWLRKEAFRVAVENDTPISVSRLVSDLLEEARIRTSSEEASKHN